MKNAERRALRDRCRWLNGHGPVSAAAHLQEVAAYCEAHDVALDQYGEGAFLERFEAQVAERLGFEAARFMPSGTMAQQIALRIYGDLAGNPHVGMHPTAHVELHEERGYAHLHGLRATLVGSAGTPLVDSDFESLSEPLAALLIELPIREAGGQLPTWNELAALKQSVGATETRLHLDGARLWECAPHYERPYDEICAGFDSVYVSFYKGIGALPGAMLLGTRDFIDTAKLWQRRSGGNLYTLTPNAASAAMQFESRLERMPRYHTRAAELAKLLGQVEGIRVLPDPPHTNMMHVFLDTDSESARTARDRFAQERGVWLCGGTSPADAPGMCRVELYIGDGALTVQDAEITDGFRAMLTLSE